MFLVSLAFLAEITSRRDRSEMIILVIFDFCVPIQSCRLVEFCSRKYLNFRRELTSKNKIKFSFVPSKFFSFRIFNRNKNKTLNKPANIYDSISMFILKIIDYFLPRKKLNQKIILPSHLQLWLVSNAVIKGRTTLGLGHVQIKIFEIDLILTSCVKVVGEYYCYQDLFCHAQSFDFCFFEI